MPRPRKDGTMQLCLPLLSAAEKVELRAFFEASTGKTLGRHRRRRHQLGQQDKPRGKILAAVEAGHNKAIATNGPVSD